MLKALKKIDQILVKACDIFLIFTIIVMVLMVVWQVICRFIIHMSTPYAEEFARLAIVWCILIGGAMAVRSNDHIRVDSLTNILPKSVQFILQLGSYILTFVFAAVILKYSYDFKYTGEGTSNTIEREKGKKYDVFRTYRIEEAPIKADYDFIPLLQKL